MKCPDDHVVAETEDLLKDSFTVMSDHEHHHRLSWSDHNHGSSVKFVDAAHGSDSEYEVGALHTACAGRNITEDVPCCEISKFLPTVGDRNVIWIVGQQRNG